VNRDREALETGGRGASDLPLRCLALFLLLLPLPAREDGCRRLLERAEANPRLSLSLRKHPASGTSYLSGFCRVFENRETKRGREIELNLIVLPATGDDPAPDPMFVFHGGPGAAATTYLGRLAGSWIRERRDVVLIDQRGTGGSNPLHVPLPGGDDDLQGYLDPVFRVEVFRAALPRLQRIADLTRYTTPIAADDANEVREALGYGKINLMGGSYGSRAVLSYLRRHPGTARTAIVNGVAPVAFKNPLYHAAAAQEGLERLFEEVEAEPRYRKAFPDLRRRFRKVLERLSKAPVSVEVTHPGTGEPATVTLGREAFAEALRILMYYTGTNRQVPALLERACEGDFAPFAQRGIESNRAIRGILCFGMLMCVTGSEDIPRIDPASIPKLTRNTFLGDGRVRRQMAVAKIWPRGEVPEDYGEPVAVDVPVLLWSGTHDPVTPPRWGEEAARHLPNGVHLVVPGAHGVAGPHVREIERAFLESGGEKEIDLRVVKKIRMPPLALPKARSETDDR